MAYWEPDFDVHDLGCLVSRYIMRMWPSVPHLCTFLHVGGLHWHALHLEENTGRRSTVLPVLRRALLVLWGSCSKLKPLPLADMAHGRQSGAYSDDYDSVITFMSCATRRRFCWM